MHFVCPNNTVCEKEEFWNNKYYNILYFNLPFQCVCVHDVVFKKLYPPYTSLHFKSSYTFLFDSISYFVCNYRVWYYNLSNPKPPKVPVKHFKVCCYFIFTIHREPTFLQVLNFAIPKYLCIKTECQISILQYLIPQKNSVRNSWN